MGPSVTDLQRQLLGGPGGHRLGGDPHCGLLASNHLFPLAEVIPSDKEVQWQVMFKGASGVSTPLIPWHS